jgi:hypothetical protein
VLFFGILLLLLSGCYNPDLLLISSQMLHHLNPPPLTQYFPIKANLIFHLVEFRISKIRAKDN